MQAKERLYLTADKKALVGEGDKRASFLYAVPGDEIPADAAEKFGLKEGLLPASAAKEAKERANKEAKAGENKDAK
ncbi:hypothetical protein SmedWSM1115_15280 [Sinorhizobium medicae WSM1115]|uniref:hypothetical protein n=2 Tax=Sinorhizobium medicae TaxID=110321 RepID=UPI000377C43C|nr:hypothetical protein [Sinorhizobium medicae]UFX01150.1 hypothetical protein SmedWSM1115_15280 [Sinorhizobium medicae WSM1115]